MDMMAFHDVAAIVMFQNRRHGLHGLEEKIHPYGKIGAIEDSSVAFVSQFANFVDVLVPAGGAYHHGDSSLDTADDIRNHGVWVGEIYHRLDLFERGRGQGTAVL